MPSLLAHIPTCPPTYLSTTYPTYARNLLQLVTQRNHLFLSVLEGQSVLFTKIYGRAPQESVLGRNNVLRGSFTSPMLRR